MSSPSALVTLALALLFLPFRALAQTPPGQGQVVIVMPFTGEATEDLLTDAENSVRSGLVARGAAVPDRITVSQAAGVSPPTDPPAVVTFAHNMGGTHALTGTVQPLAGQYTLTLTVYDATTGRHGTRQGNIGDENASAAVTSLLDQLFAPGALSDPSVLPQTPATPPPDLEAARRAEEERRRQEAARQAEAAQRHQEWEAAHPEQSYAAGGPVGIGLSFGFGGLASGARSAPSNVVTGSAPSSSRFAFSGRLEGMYALDAVPGLEVGGGLLLQGTPTIGFGLGAGAQYNLPARSRGSFRVTAGALVGFYQGLSGAMITSAWISPYVRAEYQLVPQFALFAGLGMDIVPGSNGGLVTIDVLAGARYRFGGGG